MKVIEQADVMFKIALNLKRQGKTIGFVPTMGALHEGHTSLVLEASKDNDIVIVSIYVNPTQFGPNEDLDKYPKTFEEDKALLESLNVDYLFFPNNEEMYPEDFETYVDLEKVPQNLCGQSRPSHFRGVATIVTKLFHITQPDTAYFGQKDYQQSVIIRKMVKNLNFFIQIKVCPIVRENDGLAMSSRNRYLTPKERKDAVALFESLQLAKKAFKEGEMKSETVLSSIRELIQTKVPDAKIDYVALVHPDTLLPEKEVKRGNVLALAVFIGKTRLIDNIIFE